MDGGCRLPVRRGGSAARAVPALHLPAEVGARAVPAWPSRASRTVFVLLRFCYKRGALVSLGTGVSCGMLLET